jgi:prephenate dehydrogenase
MSTETLKKVLIVGAGPVGSLTALTFHKRGWQVEIWEGRDGMFSVSRLNNIRSDWVEEYYADYFLFELPRSSRNGC